MICAGFKRNGQPCCFKPKKGSSFCGHPNRCRLPRNLCPRGGACSEMGQGNAHGMQWKAVYHELMKPFLALRCWSPHEKEKLSKPGAKQRITLEDLRRENPGCQFLMEAKKGQQFHWRGHDCTVVRRTAAFYRCLDIKTGEIWRIHKRARVTLA